VDWFVQKLGEDYAESVKRGATQGSSTIAQLERKKASPSG
jgi:hypothetical protein